jgi:hypothetical protein
MVDDKTNEQRRVGFRAMLTHRGIEYVESLAHDTSEKWPDEIGVALRGVSRDEARGIARGWDQYAYYEVDADEVIVRSVASNAVLV